MVNPRFRTLASFERIRNRLGGWLQRQSCRFGLHAYVDRDEPGWPKMQVCTWCGDTAEPDVDGVGPPDDQRGRERD